MSLLDTPVVFVGCPLRNRQITLNRYLDALYRLNYPRERIHLGFLVNNSTDQTFITLQRFISMVEHEYAGTHLLQWDLDESPTFDRLREGRSYLHYECLAKVRNRFLQMFSTTNADYLFSVDSDIIIHPDTLNRLLSHQKDIVAALVSNGSNVWNVMMWGSRGEADHLQQIPNVDLFRVDVTGACYLIHSRVIHAGVQYGFHRQGEDLAFCLEAQRRKFEIFCDPQVQPLHLLA